MKLRREYGFFKHFNKLSFWIETGKFPNILIDLNLLQHINNTINTKQILFSLILNPQLRILTALLKIRNKRLKKHLQHCINLGRLPQLRLLFERQHYWEDLLDGYHGLDAEFAAGLQLVLEFAAVRADFVEGLHGLD